MPDAPASALRPLDLGEGVVEISRRLVDVPSVSGDEASLADLIEAALAGAEHLELVRDGDAIVARTGLGRPVRVVIAGHIDTVPINGNVPGEIRTVDGEEVLWGRGSVDMKAGVAVQLKLAAELVAPAVDVTWIWYDHEEVEASKNGLARLARTRPELLAGDFAVLGEPTAGEVEGGCNGTLRVVLTARGRRAHSARAWMGENAIHALAPALERLAAYEPATIEVDGLAYREGLNAVAIGGGVAGNVIPDLATLTVNYRFAPDKTAAEAEARMRELFPEYELVVDDASEGARPGLDAPIAQEFLRAVDAVARPKYGWTDVARFSALGIPAVNFGPGDPSLAHADDERVPSAQIEHCERALRAWLIGG
ncbi:succinyl-diaminopimelate desuccinylase [Agromyces archimandritae]|uniref:Succinyl-diaminopimelate desuccinylase n=1 Tax=Agromyces archimandritae TaxID=2781962 RepID=A0A975FKM1_9MICO|nr:succinyl-diaminopimelate desuccinylase [Agromyces archimandritae]QTX04260.1 succinyl-diaminopimelate desuccinylase [Agromyces archimandritae]